MKKLNLTERFKQEICSFETAKKIAAAGMTCANTFIAYNKDGEVNDAAWMQNITGIKLYPCVNFALACIMMEDTSIDFNNTELYQDGDMYRLTWENEVYENTNIVDLLMELWVKFKNEG